MSDDCPARPAFPASGVRGGGGLRALARGPVNPKLTRSQRMGDRPVSYDGRMAIVRLRGQLEKLAGGSEHPIAGGTVAELLQGLESSHAALEGWILDERGVVRRHINV